MIDSRFDDARQLVRSMDELIADASCVVRIFADARQLVRSMDEPSKMKKDLSLLPDEEISPASTESEGEPIQMQSSAAASSSGVEAASAARRQGAKAQAERQEGQEGQQDQAQEGQEGTQDQPQEK